MKALIALYHFPPGFPPTLSAIDSLSPHFEQIIILSRNLEHAPWPYPSNVREFPSGSLLTTQAAHQKPGWRKALAFGRFMRDLSRLLRRQCPALLILYDPLPLMAFYLIRSLLPYRPVVWYHNHDVIDATMKRTSMLAALAARVEGAALQRVDVFSLPALERKTCFDLRKFQGLFLFLPNYPSLHRYRPYYREKTLKGREITLIFQGFIGPQRGLEAIIEHVLPQTWQGKTITLHLKGAIKPAYREQLLTLARRTKVESQVHFEGYGSYEDVPRSAARCNIGIAIFTGQTIMDQTLGTASNKIYEYAALALPVLLFDTPHFREHLGRYPWAVFTDLSPASLQQGITTVLDNYESLSKLAHQSFLEENHFERFFEPALQQVLNLMAERLPVPKA